MGLLILVSSTTSGDVICLPNDTHETLYMWGRSWNTEIERTRSEIMKASGVFVVAVFISGLRMTESREGMFPIIFLLDIKCVLDLGL